nr:phosphoprotein [Vesicular stomatitis virus]
MDSINQLKEYMKTYTQLDGAIQEIDELESNREEKTNFELFQDEGLELKSTPSYYDTLEDDELSDPDDEDTEAPQCIQFVEGYDNTSKEQYEDEDVEVAFTSELKLPELESDSTGKSLTLTIPGGLTTEQRSQWTSTIEALVQSAKYWNIAECSVEKMDHMIIIRERRMIPDIHKVNPSPNAPQSTEPFEQDVWILSSKVHAFPAKKPGISPLSISLDELFSSREEFLSVGGNGMMTHKEALLLGLRHKKLYNQARVRYHLG